MATSAFSVVGGGQSVSVSDALPESASPVGAPVAKPSQIQYTEWAQDAVWQGHVSHCRGMPGPLTLLEVCAGAGTPYIAMQELLGVAKVKSVGFYDFDKHTKGIAYALHGSSDHVHVGDSGNILTVPLDQFPSANVVVAGPPCPPWSSSGMR
eukprot:4950889-Lingulodinium_polyedra.AAC.1